VGENRSIVRIRRDLRQIIVTSCWKLEVKFVYQGDSVDQWLVSRLAALEVVSSMLLAAVLQLLSKA